MHQAIWQRMRTAIKFCIAMAISLIVGLLILTSRTSEIRPGATSAALISRCELIRLDTWLQPQHTIVLACQRKDMIWLWPLTVQCPWFEDVLDFYWEEERL